MHKNGKWATRLIELQDSEGKWGWFHSLSQFYDSPITTEQALRRLQILGYTAEDDCIQKALSYMDACLKKEKEIPDRREKLHNWDLFTEMIVATWVRRFTLDNPLANRVAAQWTDVITAAFSTGSYQHETYLDTYEKVFGLPARGGRFVDFAGFYRVSLLKDCLDERTEKSILDYLLNHESGIYYIYGSKLAFLPKTFASKNTSAYLGAMELLADYTYAREKLQFVKDWLLVNQNENGKWDMGKTVNDKLYFPLSDDWRKTSTREADCTERITKLLDKLQLPNS